MSNNYTPEEVRVIYEEKNTEHYRGKIILHFDGTGIPSIEYNKTEKKVADEVNNRRRKRPSDGLHSR